MYLRRGCEARRPKKRMAPSWAEGSARCKIHASTFLVHLVVHWVTPPEFHLKPQCIGIVEDSAFRPNLDLQSVGCVTQIPTEGRMYLRRGCEDRRQIFSRLPHTRWVTHAVECESFSDWPPIGKRFNSGWPTSQRESPKKHWYS